MEIKRGILLAFNTSAYTADVLFLESTSYALSDIPVSNMLDGSSAVVGALCAVHFFNEQNPQDAVVLAVFGNAQTRFPAPPPGRVTFVTGYRQFLNRAIAAGVTSSATLTGGSSGIPQGVRGVLYRVSFSSATVGAALALAPQGASDIEVYAAPSAVSVANTVVSGSGLLQMDSSGRIVIKASGGNCTVTLYTYGYVH